MSLELGIPEDLLDARFLPERRIWDFHKCYRLPYENVEKRISSGELSLCATDDVGRLFLHSAIDNCDMRLQYMLFVKGKEELASTERRCCFSLIDWRADGEDLPLASQYVDADEPFCGLDMPCFLETPLDNAAKWGRREQCYFWASRAMAGTVARAVGVALEYEWFDCVDAFCLGGYDGASRWSRRFWWFLMREKGMEPFDRMPALAFELIVRFS
eukprot:TRINITY_DN18777_c0_g2_i1.p1 TRINITY_DN18777_c0_g2~~TRINITY_DN18777_c0_g2_i1.p1  ORF type:complete len:215 (+),score=37.54 TRINITY_DN18777_c0_g2_i1:99-743(+)